MKTTNTKIVLSAIIVTTATALALTKVEENLVPNAAVAISYLAVAAMFVLAALDNRRGSKDYLAR